MRQNATRRRTEKARINTEVSVPITLTRLGRVEVASINVAAKAGNRHAASTLGVRACRMPKDDAGTPLMRHDVAVRSNRSRAGVLKDLLMRPRIDMAGGALTATIFIPQSRKASAPKSAPPHSSTLSFEMRKSKFGSHDPGRRFPGSLCRCSGGVLKAPNPMEAFYG
jgi:hypothetical protein